MEKIVFDSGVREYEINNNGVLRFNPSDPNVYARFFEAVEQIRVIEKELVAKGEMLRNEADGGEVVVQIMKEADQKVKEILNEVFGNGSDFDQMLGGLNLLAVADNGERVVTNLFQALLPIIKQGAKRCAEQKVGDAVRQAQANRAQRRAQK